MQHLKYFTYSLLFAALMWLGWTPRPFFFTLLIAFVPLLILEDELRRKNKSAWWILFYNYIAFLFWNLFCTWWVGNTYYGTEDITSVIAGLFANITNPLLMSIPVFLYLRTKRKLGWKMGLISLPLYWMCLEWLHLNWDLAWPWLNLGNGLSQYPQVIQWYEYTGTFGGSLWIWLCNISIYVFFFSEHHQPKKISKWIYTSALILLPLFLSQVIYSFNNPAFTKARKKNIVVVQPNIDPYNTKFDFSTLGNQLDELLKLSAEKADANTDYIVWPETAIPQGIWLNEIDSNKTILKIRNFLRTYPKAKLVTGISAYKYYETKPTVTARRFSDGSGYYDSYNSAVQLDSTNKYQLYHKSKLVIGVESVPYPAIFHYMEPLLVKFGGISVSLGSQKKRNVFFADDSTGVAPVICYESVFGEYCNEYVHRGANFIFIVTNDGWWGNSAGHIQHEHYAVLRAIETRRCIARSANTGTSCFINSRGDISDETVYWKPAVIKATLPVLGKETFYVKHGDYIAHFALILSALIYISTFFFKKRNDATE